ncbi:adenylate/guanylate cyclase domain-containing protein [Microcoleus sp. A2-C5]|uniref:adenylate/guanylate cyclase domain-containing protein n=1 Tax=unclassified Microcoleus TaxID=2642155 RepID=UPI002FD5ACCB
MRTAILESDVDRTDEVGQLAKSFASMASQLQTSFAGYQPIQVGVGVHFGHMMVGIVGEAERMQGDAFSDNVNLASRLESLTKL